MVIVVRTIYTYWKAISNLLDACVMNGVLDVLNLITNTTIKGAYGFRYVAYPGTTLYLVVICFSL